MNVGVVGLGIISTCIGVGIGIKVFHIPIKIEFKISMFNSFVQAFGMFFMITATMALEMSINQLQLLLFSPVSWRLRLLSQLIDEGLIVALLLPLLSILFEKWIRGFDMDLSAVYSEKVIKICYSLAIITNCIWYLYMIGPNIINDSLESRSILSRVIIWMLSVFGAWMGIGFHCKGRIDEEIECDYKSREVLTWKEHVEYGIPFGLAFIVNCVVLVVQTLNTKMILNYIGDCYIIVMSGLVGMLCAVIGYRCIEIPSEKKSNRKLSKALKRAVTEKSVEGRYQSVRYKLVNEGEKKYLEIQKKNVIWEGHEEEVENMFGERRLSIEQFEYFFCQKYLRDLLKEQREFIQKGYTTCRDNTHKQIRDERLKVIKG